MLAFVKPMEFPMHPDVNLVYQCFRPIGSCCIAICEGSRSTSDVLGNDSGLS